MFVSLQMFYEETCQTPRAYLSFSQGYRRGQEQEGNPHQDER